MFGSTTANANVVYPQFLSDLGKIWFTQLQQEYKVKRPWFGFARSFDLDGGNKNPVQWDWDNCTIDGLAPLPENKIRIVIGSKTNRNSRYMGNKPVRLRYRLEIAVSNISVPKVELYTLKNTRRKDLKSLKQVAHNRYVVQLDDRYWFWEWAKDGQDIRSSRIYKLYENILEFRDSMASLPKNQANFKLDIPENLDIIPVIYQPAVDSLKNFVRELHCHKDNSNEIEVTIIFNNERLMEHAILNSIYELYRKLVFGRILDIETFKIIVDSNGASEYLTFKNIYSGRSDLEHDNIHGDSEDLQTDSDDATLPHHPILYCVNGVHNRQVSANSPDHPVVFVNTSNHAMAEFDTNFSLWKWEYIAWLPSAPIELGSKSRKEIDAQFPSLFRRILAGFK